MNKILVSEKPLRELLTALVSAPHRIREIQVTQDLPSGMSDDNPLNILLSEFNEPFLKLKN